MAKKDKKEKKGLLGRLFGGKEGGDQPPATPTGDEGAMDAATIPPRDEVDQMATLPPPDAVRPGAAGGFQGGAALDPEDQPTMMPFDRPPGLVKPGARTPAAKGPEKHPILDPEDQPTMMPFDRPKGLVPAARKGAPLTPPAAPVADFTPSGETISPSAGARSPGLDDLLGPDAATIPPGFITGGRGAAAPGGKAPPKPATPPGAEADPFGLVTADPDLAPAPRAPTQDPFAFGPGDDLLGDIGGDLGGPPPPAPARPAPAPAPGALDDPFGFGADVPDLLAPAPGAPMQPARAAAPAPVPADPFGAALGADPFADPAADPFGVPPPVAAAPPPLPVAPPPAPATPQALGGRTDEIDVFDVDLGSESAVKLNAPKPPAPAAPEAAPADRAGPEAEVFQEEQTLEMDRPQAIPAKPAMPLVARPEPRPQPVKRTLFASQVTKPDGSRRLGPPASEVVVDHEKGVFWAPAIAGGWADVPPFAAVLSDGTVVGRLPAGTSREPDGGLVVPAMARREAVSDGPARKVAAFPAGVKVDRTAGVAFAPTELAEQVASSAVERTMRVEGGVVALVPAGARWNDDGSYQLPPEPPRPPEAGVDAAKAPDESLAPAHVAHGAARLKLTYLGCEEIVYEDGWASLALPKAAKVEGDRVLLPPASRSEPGAPPESLEVTTRPNGWLEIKLPEGFVPEGDRAWIAPAPIALCGEVPVDDDGFGEPVSVLTYAGIEDRLYANGWIRLDLPPGASVAGRTLRIPREYAHAGDAKAIAQFDRELDGSLVLELPADAEASGGAILLPPLAEGGAPPPAPPARDAAPSAEIASPKKATKSVPAVVEAPAPAAPETSTSSDADAPLTRSRSSGSAESVMPPGGSSLKEPPRTKGLDRFRAKKASEPKDDPKPDEPKADELKREPKADEPKVDEPKADEPKADEPKADEPKADEPKVDEPKVDEPKAEEPKVDEPKAEEPKADEPQADEAKTEGTKADEPQADEAKTEGTKADEPKVDELEPDADLDADTPTEEGETSKS